MKEGVQASVNSNSQGSIYSPVIIEKSKSCAYAIIESPVRIKGELAVRPSGEVEGNSDADSEEPRHREANTTSDTRLHICSLRKSYI